MSEEIEEFVENHVKYQSGLRDGIEKGIEKGINQGIKQGISQGLHEKEKSIIINMYNKKYELKDIAEITNLTIEEVEEIINKAK